MKVEFKMSFENLQKNVYYGKMISPKRKLHIIMRENEIDPEKDYEIFYNKEKNNYTFIQEK